MFFNKSIGGIYECGDATGKSAYTFPQGVFIQINGVKLDISLLRVENFGGKYDKRTIEHFVEVASKIQPRARNTLNPIFLKDSLVSGGGYPRKEDFERYQLPFFSRQDFIGLQKFCNTSANPEKRLVEKAKALVSFFNKWTEDNRRIFQKQLNTLLEANAYFPKKISVAYDDSDKGHTTHIVLEYISKDNCILHIDNTSSLSRGATNKILQICAENNLDFSIAKETINERPNCITLRTKTREIHIEVHSINELIQDLCGRMGQILHDRLGIPIKNTSFLLSPYNQKNSDECAPFAIQNQLDFIEGKPKNLRLEDRVPQIAARVRAEQAVMSYLFTGRRRIPRFDEATACDYGFTYASDDIWYPNYPQVCNEIDQRIGALPFPLLERLYLATELGELSSLHHSFQAHLFKCIDVKSNPADYEPLCASSLSEEDSIELQKMLAPTILYRVNTFFVKKAISGAFNKAAFFAVANKA